jgi:hypothetical protein
MACNEALSRMQLPCSARFESRIPPDQLTSSSPLKPAGLPRPVERGDLAAHRPRVRPHQRIHGEVDAHAVTQHGQAARPERRIRLALGRDRAHAGLDPRHDVAAGGGVRERYHRHFAGQRIAREDRERAAHVGGAGGCGQQQEHESQALQRTSSLAGAGAPTRMRTPVIDSDAGEARNATTRPISSGRACRRPPR